VGAGFAEEMIEGFVAQGLAHWDLPAGGSPFSYAT
jgi:hypothetical protein